MSQHDPIEVTIKSRYLPNQSSPADDRYAFAYHITLQNHGREQAQLLRRHWIITDANGEIEEVEGDGVVGEQPIISPGASYEYTSGALLKTPLGTMQGKYHMMAENGTPFDTQIPIFRLAVPGIVN